MSDVYKCDPFAGYEETHGEYPVPKGMMCYYKDGTLCMYAEDQDEGSWCEKYGCKIIEGYYKHALCD